MNETLVRSWRCGPGPFEAALEEFGRFGGMIEGTPSAGSLWADTPLGRIEGNYGFDGEVFTVTITGKPRMLPAAMIWDRLDRICGPPVAIA